MKNKSKKSILNTVWESVLEQLRGRAVKLALIKLIGTTVGFKAWLIKFVLENLIDEVGIPVVNAGVVEVKYYFDKKDGTKVAIKIEKARSGDDQGDYDDAVDDLYN